ncbi:acyl-CoA thioesterase II [Testudinibacter aquarius]|uniref:Acyl-CoA thioesterase 2 n=1 Tax=Testudinibacter aquarius TaxID=1524974 RepID=A0A4R3YFP0_9PAST|nr:acyl-CoA thioesterase II [Testudinibacter aquarius]KAE9529287.1 acyl-CoA thioesterase II [Testudinibacter aquarius]TCV89744.1 acyl-CoA thioesterase-2 [Testudinibacter aquarius]TNG93709.1 acyl-CoA thioesterase II [Testudinibacter aquarius]
MSNVLNQLIDLLTLETIDDHYFRGQSVDLGLRQVFGGQVIAQALAAGINVAPADRTLHSCHAYFLRSGDAQHPILYDVETLREGRSFTALRIKAIQHNEPICHVTASFQRAEPGFDHQSPMPEIEPPDQLINELEAVRAVAQYLPPSIKQTLIADRPFDVRAKYLNNPFQGREFPAQQYAWFKANGQVPEDLKINQCLLAYFSDFHCLLTALHPHKKGFLEKGMKVATIDHAIWFHRPFDLNDWLLHAVESNNAYGARGLARGQIFDQNGKLIATTQQEGLIRFSAE